MEASSTTQASKPSKQKAWELNVMLWYLFYLGSQVSVYPFLTAWFATEDGPGPLNPKELGYIGCARPWIMVPSSFLWGLVADKFHAHRAILIGCLITATIVRCLLYWSQGFTQVMALMLLMQVLSSPVMMLADAMVNAACTKEGDYGVLRKWGAVGWGGMSFVSGAFIDAYGMGAGFLLHVLLALPCLYFAWMLHSTGNGGAQKGAGKLSPFAGSSRGSEQAEGLTGMPESHAIHSSALSLEGKGTGEHVIEEAATKAAGTEDAMLQLELRRRVEELVQVHVRDGAKGASKSRQKKLAAKRKKAKEWRDNRALECVQEAEREGSLDLSIEESQGQKVLPCDSLSASDDDQLSDEDVTEQQHLLGPKHGKLSHSFTPLHAKSAANSANSMGLGHAPYSTAGGAPTLVAKLRAMMGSVHIILFLLQATLFGYGFGTIESFLFVFLQELGANSTLMGLTLTITCMAEVPIFQLTGWLVGKLGAPRLMQVTMACYAIRMYAYATLPTVGAVWAVLPVEVLHGITFGLGWCVGTTMCRRLAPPGMVATMQGMFQACYFGFGYGIGGLAGGFMSHSLDFPAMFALSATIVCGLGSAILIARCFAGPSPYDVNPDESNATSKWQHSSTREQSEGLELGVQCKGMHEGAGVRGKEVTQNSEHQIGLTTMESSTQRQGMDHEDSKV